MHYTITDSKHYDSIIDTIRNIRETKLNKIEMRKQKHTYSLGELSLVEKK